MFKFITNYFAKRTLRTQLNHPSYKFRSLTRLAASIGQSENDTVLLLTAIGARKSRRRGQQIYGLVSRVGSGRRGNCGVVTG